MSPPAAARRRFALGASVALCAVVLAAPTCEQQSFQDGVAPDAAYLGTRDVRLQVSDFDPTSGASTNYDLEENQVDGYPADKSVLMRWDLTAIPPGTALTAVTLWVNVTSGSSNAFPIYELLRPWSETEATFLQWGAGSAWSVSGARGVGTDRRGTSLGDMGWGNTGARSVTLNASGLAVVQRWVDDPATNHGFIAQNYAVGDGLDWTNSEASTAAIRPMLEVSHTGGTVTVRLQNGVSPSATYAGNTDTTIAYAPEPGMYNWNGAGLEVIADDGAGHPVTSLLAFDLSSIPDAGYVTGVELQVRFSSAANASAGALPAYEVFKPWTEAATFITYDGVNGWDDGGASGPTDHGDEVLVYVGPSDAGRLIFAFTDAGVDAVQAWVSGARPNHGFVIHDLQTLDLARFDEREVATAANRPRLTVYYSMPDPVDAGQDAGVPDAGPPDAGPPDAGQPDAGPPDAGQPDAGQPDAGQPDAGPPDSGQPDAGQPDAGQPDAGQPDAGQPDAGAPPWVVSGSGCGCGTAGVPGLAWALGLLLLIWRRRAQGDPRGT